MQKIKSDLNICYLNSLLICQRECLGLLLAIRKIHSELEDIDNTSTEQLFSTLVR